MASITQQFTLPNEKFRLEEINLPEELAASLAGQTVAVKVLPEVPSRTLRIDLDNPQAVGVSVFVDDDGTAWNDDWPARVPYTDPEGPEWRLPRHWLSEGVSPVIAASRFRGFSKQVFLAINHLSRVSVSIEWAVYRIIAPDGSGSRIARVHAPTLISVGG